MIESRLYDDPHSNITGDHDPAYDAGQGPADDAYVGYGHPPKSTRFKPDQPRPKGAGRKKGSLNKSTMRNAFHRFFFEETVVVKSKGGASTRNVRRFDALLTTAFDRAIKGSSRDLKTLMDAMLKLADDAEDPDDQLARMISKLSRF